MTRFRMTLLALVFSVSLIVPAAAAASNRQFTIFEAPRELSSGDAALRSSTYDEIRGLGVNHIRVLMYWNNVAPANDARTAPAGDLRDPGAGYRWDVYDRVIREATARGLKVVVTLTGAVPRWATAHRKGHTYKPSRSRFQQFVTAAGRRYGDAVDTWTIWNEPNHPQFLTPQFRHGKPYSPRLYRGLYQAALAGLGASGNGADRVLAGETAPRGTPRVVAPVTFARGFFRGKTLKVSGYAHHPYTTRSGPFFEPGNRHDVTIGVLSRLTRALDRYSHHRKLGLYLTEFGIQSAPDPFVGVSQTRQAEYRSIAERIAYRNARVRAFSQYMMRDDLPRGGSRYARYSGFESGLRTSGGRTKPAYDGFRLPLVADRSGHHVVLWGLARPAPAATVVALEYRGRGSKRWKALKSVSTNAAGYFSTRTSFKRGRSYRVRWNGFTGPRTRVY
jgi:hypothetical protein